MYIYISIFLISYIFAVFAEKKLKKNHIKSFCFFSVIAILIPSILAGLRASGIGTDTKVYIDWVFIANAYSNNISEAFQFIQTSGIEPLYCLVNYIVTRFSSDLTIIYFVLTFIFLFFSYFGCVKMAKKLKFSFSFSYLILLMLFFNKSLNMCRQSLAMSICLFSLSYIISREWKKFFLCMIIAFCFHRSVLLFIPLYFLYNLNINKTKNKQIIKIVIISSIIFTSICFKPIIIILVDIGLLSEKYLNYVYIFGNTINVKLIEILAQLILLIIPFFFKEKLVKHSKYNEFLVFIMILAFATFLFGFSGSFLQRISYYFSFTSVVLIPQFISCCKRSKDKILVMLLIFIPLCCYSYLYYEKYQFDQTVPYKIDISSEKIVK